MTTPAQDLAKLLYSYNPDLPMGPGMKAEYLALRKRLDEQASDVVETARKHSHYFKDVSNLQTVDVYRVLELFNVVNPCLQHAVKKLLVAGGRGAKGIQKDVQEAIDTLERWKEMGQEVLCKDEGCDHAGTEHVCVPAKGEIRSWWDDALLKRGECKVTPSIPAIGEIWPEQGGIYAGVSRGEEGEPDSHLVLLDAVPEQNLNWADAIKWADGLGNGARLPTRFESALLYANLRDKLDTERWHWTGTQYSAYDAWYQFFYTGFQVLSDKSSEARARAVRLIPFLMDDLQPATASRDGLQP